MNTLSVGQSLTSYGNEFAVCMVSKTNEQITYTLVGMNNPALTDVREVSLRFYRLEEKIYSVKEVSDRHAIVKSAIENREAEKRDAQEKRRLAEQKEKHDPANAELLTVEHESNTTKLAAKNIRILLKKHFRGIKFSVRMRDYNAIYVSWCDGPTKEAVDELIGHFQEGRFDGMQDMYEFNDSVFNRVFGGVMYLFTERSLSDELVTEAIAQLRDRFGETAVPHTTTAEAFRKGLLWNHSFQSFHNGLQSEIHKQAAKIDKTK